MTTSTAHASILNQKKTERLERKYKRSLEILQTGEYRFCVRLNIAMKEETMADSEH